MSIETFSLVYRKLDADGPADVQTWHILFSAAQIATLLDIPVYAAPKRGREDTIIYEIDFPLVLSTIISCTLIRREPNFQILVDRLVAREAEKGRWEVHIVTRPNDSYIQQLIETDRPTFDQAFQDVLSSFTPIPPKGLVRKGGC